MRIKGHTRIELRDAITGEEKRFEHENELTDFAAEFFRECGALNYYPLDSLPTKSYILDDLFGGIMCLEKPILSNSAQFPTRKPLYVPANNKMTANASIDNAANSGKGVTELGQYNSGESSADAEVRRYVYDWDTNEGIGDISAICLTTRAGGYIGAGNARSDKADLALLTCYWATYNGGTVNTRTIDSDTRARICALDIGNAQVATLTDTAKAALQAGSVTINWYDAPISKLNPFENINTFKDYNTVEGVKILKTPRRTETHAFTAVTVQAARVMGGTGYILLVGANYNQIQNGATVNARQINKDGTVTEFSATVAGLNDYIYLNDANFIGGQIISGALYLAFGYLSGTNNTVRVKIASDGATTNYTGNSAEGYNDLERCFFTQEGRVFLGGYNASANNNCGSRYVDTVTGEVVKTNARGFSTYPSSTYTAGLWACYDSINLFCPYGSTNASPLISPLSILRAPCNWLSTINNLNNTITKTGTQTMKITYTLTLYRET